MMTTAKKFTKLGYIVLMLYILAAGAYLRLVGLDWDAEQHLHPDERFLTMVESSLEPVQSLGDYFDTVNSSLNPHNRGHGFFVYGTLPIFIVRYVADWLGNTGYGEVYRVGRALSALADLGVIWLIFLTGERLYRRKVGVLAAAFYAFAVLPIQQSHFFTVDTFINFFTFLAFYFAVAIATEDGRRRSTDPVEISPLPVPGLPSYILFGIALGMAVASKINAIPVALALPGAAVLYFLRLPVEERQQQAGRILGYAALAGLVSILTFRIFQPYAFSGPGFFGMLPNPQWVENLKSLSAQTGGDVDFPPALQWARRPLWFSWQNLTVWGLGLPLGLLAWAGFLWMGWRMFKGEWRQHILLWGWTTVYFVWQSLQWNSTMRYQLPIYPALAMMAAWIIVSRRQTSRRFDVKPFVGGVVLILTFLWAFSFSRIYTVPHTRVEATHWMLQHFAGPITLQIETDDGVYAQPLPFSQGLSIGSGAPYHTQFTAYASGTLNEILLPHVADVSAAGNLIVSLTSAQSPDTPLVVTTLSGADLPLSLPDSSDFAINFGQDVFVGTDSTYVLTFEVLGGLEEVDVCDVLHFEMQTVDQVVMQDVNPGADCTARPDSPYTAAFIPLDAGTLSGFTARQLRASPTARAGEKTLTASLSLTPDGEPVAAASITDEFLPGADYRGTRFSLQLDTPLELVEDTTYYLNFDLNGVGQVQLSGAALANETTWDDGLPLRMDGYDPYGGIYQGGLNFEMYWDDNDEKLQRFTGTLAQADYVLITSSRQWASTTRVPERYPLTSEYYRHLLGCPVEQTIEWCYTVAEPGMFVGDFGFELVQVFQSNPRLGNFEINDQFAEEAFTVYDHPKVFVFAKTEAYSPERVAEILGAVDLEKVVRVTPKQAGSFPANLMLPADRLAQQRTGGTWAEIFNTAALQNRSQIVGALLWYCSVFALGLMTYPLVRFAMSGLPDRGYPLARVTGLVLLAWLVWMAGSARIPITRLTIGLVLLLMALLGGWLAYRQRDGLRAEWREKRKYFLTVEGLFLLFFLIFLLIRLGNPDLWHPWKGGEKPMDLSYFNAVLKSTTFPPYDPWFAGGYINYYYYGYVIVGVLVKFLGIVPTFAYNLILPTLFSLVAMGAFSIVWNLSSQRSDVSDQPLPAPRSLLFSSLGGALAMSTLGNLGILQMLMRGYQRLIVPSEEISSGHFFQRLWWALQGFIKSLGGAALNYRLDEWYWNPSRVIGAEHGNPITEFPFFTFLYADLHAHMIAMPIALLVVGWALSVVMGKAWVGRATPGHSPLRIGLSFLIGGLAIGALYPANLSDIYTYLPLGIAAVVYVLWRYLPLSADRFERVKRLLMVAGGALVLTLLARNLYQPYGQWYSQGYSEFKIWPGSHTPISDYLAHWGLFLFVIVSWMMAETIDWMAKTPVSALRKLEPYKTLIMTGLILLVAVTLLLGIDLPVEGGGDTRLPLGLGIHIIWFILPLVAWAGALMLRPDTSDAKRFVLFISGTALTLTLTVEIIYVIGDIGRMNSVFKFYLHAWTLLSVSAAAALGWLFRWLKRWQSGGRVVWQITLVFLLGVAGLYPVLGSFAKIEDRMTAKAPHNLDGMAYMQFATYYDEGQELDLSEDYAAIRWMQENVAGSPVIVEGNQVEYHWGTRYTIYTGLPSVVGWNWHQRQQRTIVPHDWVYERVDGTHEFYLTEDIEWAQNFLQTYNVSYIVLGQFERAKYDGLGLEKFDAYEGQFWDEVFRLGETVIYKVRQ